jgi:AbiU2
VMSSEITTDDAKRRHIELMGSELGSIFHALSSELTWLYAKWEEYVELFGTKSSRVDLLNKAAGQFFRVIQDSLWEDSLLHVARLTDPPSSLGKGNLSVRRLPGLIKDAEVKQNVEALVNVALEKSEFCRDWRNRRIAHRDLRLALEMSAEPLLPASRDQVRAALDSLSAVLNAVTLHYENSTTSFDGAVNWRGARSLLLVVDDGLRVQSERRRRLEVGDSQPDDYAPRDL